MKKRFTTVAGNSILVSYSASTHAGAKGMKRRPKENVTPEAVAKVNRKNRERELTAKLNHNFVPGDLWLTVTYENTENCGAGLTKERCMKNYTNFKKKLQRKAKKAGITIKAIDSFGFGERTGRPHHHIVMNDVPTAWLTEAWTFGSVHIEVLKGFSYHRIAAYMLKHAEQTADGKVQKAFRCTRNIVTPDTKVEVMKSAELPDPEDIKPLDGYYVDRDTVHTYEHPVFETECMEFIMVSLTAEARLKRWSKGRKVKVEQQYSMAWPQQIDLDKWMEDYC